MRDGYVYDHNRCRERLMAHMILPSFKQLLRCGMLAIVVSGCAMSTGVLPVGPDEYTVTAHYAPIRGGSITAQQDTLAEGNAYCAAQGKRFMALDKQTVPGIMVHGNTGYSVTFRCIDAGTRLPLPTEIVEHQFKP